MVFYYSDNESRIYFHHVDNMDNGYYFSDNADNGIFSSRFYFFFLG